LFLILFPGFLKYYLAKLYLFFVDIDTSLSGVTYQNANPIQRSVSAQYQLQLSLTYIAGDYSILQLSRERWNYEVTYALLETSITDVVTFTGTEIQNATVDLIETQKGLTVSGTGSMNVSVNVSMDLTVCEATQFLCFFLTSSSIGSYIETELSNNIECLDLTEHKQCDPRKFAFSILDLNAKMLNGVRN